MNYNSILFLLSVIWVIRSVIQKQEGNHKFRIFVSRITAIIYTK